VAEQLERAAGPLLAVDDEPPERRPPGQDRTGAERERLEDVGAASDPSVEQHLDPAADGVNDLRQRVDRGRDAVELAPAVVGDDEAGGAVLAGEAGVLRREHAPPGAPGAPPRGAARAVPPPWPAPPA